MKQVIQSYKTGELRVVDISSPQCPEGGSLVRTAFSLISAGTERAMVKLAQDSLLGKARARPDLVRKVLDRAKRDGLLATLDKVRTKLDTPIPLGYSCSGIVEQTGPQTGNVRIGDRVACAGAGYANHAELNAVPANLMIRIPDKVPIEDAACATVAAIALQGVRITQPALGENVAVIGLGLLGQMAVSILRANGCRVLAVDLDARKVAQALERGADCGSIRNFDDTAGDALRFSGGLGVDAVLITAGSGSNDPLLLAGEISRDKGRVTVVGDVPCSFSRKDYYEKELALFLSRSYGPGRYHPAYEQQGLDFPAGYVRWTENRNLECALDLMARGLLPVADLVKERFPIERAEEAYRLLLSKEGPRSHGILLEYAAEPARGPVILNAAAAKSTRGEPAIGFIGAGSFASSTLMPHFAALGGLHLRTVASARGLSARQAAEKFGFAVTASASADVIEDPRIDAVVIATRHDSHACLAASALRAGKHVFLEKPLALDAGQLADLMAAAAHSGRVLFAGFNRRFSPLTSELKAFLPAGRPLQFLYRVNAGPIAHDSWIQDTRIGGGRIIGEACHFVDLMTHLCGSLPMEAAAAGLSAGGTVEASGMTDNYSATITFANGSIGTLVYTSMGDPSCAKEVLEVYAGGKMAVLRDFRSLELTSGGKTRRIRPVRQDKGFAREVSAFAASIRGDMTGAFTLTELDAVTRTTFAIVRALASGLREPC